MRKLTVLGGICFSLAIIFASKSGHSDSTRDTFFLMDSTNFMDRTVAAEIQLEAGMYEVASGRDSALSTIKTDFNGMGVVIGVYNKHLDLVGLNYVADANSRETFPSFIKRVGKYTPSADLHAHIWYQWDADQAHTFYRYLLSKGFGDIRMHAIDKDTLGTEIIAHTHGTFSAESL
ncbi:MAG: hypothetical protein A2Y14_01050 [Verrucomicrobia bacterium GWF2_51_19]|nr:MAG: hypothetical protein A2Y14_01050 [Verrucomicrobia bacterium GWF2_51_19]HCJ12071.1 hypothetical protein [Opitutae bacterium]